jgi:UDP-glucose 4-epimerase
MKHIIVTGGAGFIGSHLAESLAQQGYVVTIVDNFHTGSRSLMEQFVQTYPKLTLFEGDYRDVEFMKPLLETADTVFHLAAWISVEESMQHPQAYIEHNSIGTLNLFQQCANVQVKTVVFSSSAGVYGDPVQLPNTETDPPQPLSPYAISKLDGECYTCMYRTWSDLHASSLRYFNVYGPRQRPDSAYAAVIPLFIKRALCNEPLVIFGDGKQTRDFVHVDDVVQANVLAVRDGNSLYNVASGFRCSIETLAYQIRDLADSRSEIQYKSKRVGDIKHSYGSIDRIKQELGYNPSITLEEGLSQTISYWKCVINKTNE